MSFIGRLNTVFKRNTGNNKFIPVIDGLRSLALLPVILMHFNTNYKRYLGNSLGDDYDSIVNNGEHGVFLFFAISGFILSLGFFNYLEKSGGIDFKRYLLRRLTRLEPPFIISTLILFFLVQLNFDGGWKELFNHLLPTLTYTHHLIFGYWSPINPVSWSLEVEIQFYLLIPLFCIFLFKKTEKSRFFLLSVLIIALPFLLVYEDSFFRVNPHFKRSLPVFVSYFLVGVLFLNLYKSAIWETIRQSIIWDFVGILSIVCFISVNFENNLPFEQIILSVLIFAIFISTFKSLLLNRLFNHSIVVVFGGMCYSIYLLHYAIIFGLSKFSVYFSLENNFLNYVFQLLLAFSAIFLISSVFYILFERPFMNNGWWKLSSRNNFFKSFFYKTFTYKKTPRY